MKNINKTELSSIYGGGDDLGSWMPWNLISDLMYEMGKDLGHWMYGTYEGSKYK